MSDDPSKTKVLPDGPAGELPVGANLSQGMYRVTGRIAAGGFGITYEARDNLDRKVAIKECFPAGLALRAGDFTVSAASASTSEPFETARNLFLREARTLAALRHPNIVHVQTLFEENGTAYMAMDYVDGRDLQDVIDHDPDILTPGYVMELTRALLAALEYLHLEAPARGKERLLHRDIKPANIRIDPLGAPVIIDFGAARQETKNQSRSAGTFRVVSDGYSPNEFYVAGTQQGPASDLYSLAATLYHCITGAAPVPADERAQKVSNGEDDPYAPIAGRFPGHDPRLLGLIDRAMARPLKDRPADAAAWLAAIPDMATRIVAPAPVPPPAPLTTPIATPDPSPAPTSPTAAGPTGGGFWKGAVAGGALLAVLGAGTVALAPGILPGGDDSALRAELATATASTRTLEQDVQALEQDVSRLTTARDQALQDVTQARSETNRMATTLAEAETELARLNGDLDAALARIDALVAQGQQTGPNPDPDVPNPPLETTSGGFGCPSWETAGPQVTFTGQNIFTAQRLSTTASGSTSLSNCQGLPVGSTGYASEVPNYTLNLSDMAPFRRLRLQVFADCDATLVVNSNDNVWHFDDDSAGNLLPLLDLVGPQAIEGRLDIWVGTYDGSSCAATLEIQSFQN